MWDWWVQRVMMLSSFQTPAAHLWILMLSDLENVLGLQLIVIIGMGPLLALKYFRVMYRPSTVNMLQRLEHQYTNSLSVETPTKSLDVSLSMTRTTFNHGSEPDSVYEPLLLPETPTFQKKSGDSEASSDSVPSSPTRVTLSTYSRSKNKWGNLFVSVGTGLMYGLLSRCSFSG